MFATVSQLYGQSEHDTCNDLSMLYTYDPMDTKFNAEYFEQRSNQPLGTGVRSHAILDQLEKPLAIFVESHLHCIGCLKTIINVQITYLICDFDFFIFMINFYTTIRV